MMCSPTMNWFKW